MLRVSTKCRFSHTVSNYLKCRKAMLHFPQPRIEPVLEGGYNPRNLEDEETYIRYFKPDIVSSTSFTMVLPPPNITGDLHLGHALTSTIQDVIVRWKRMQGIETVWVPGMDHAGIATQVVIEKCLWKQNRKTRHDVGQQAFEELMWDWSQSKILGIELQLRNLALELAWDRLVFTMDPVRSHAVAEAFIRLFEWGLIYRADHLVNWSCVLQSAISDIEVDHLMVNGPTPISVPGYEKSVEFGILTHFAYKLVDSDEEILVATTRPETMLGDVAVAVNPKDDRYSRYVGRHLWHPIRKQAIPIICDDFVKPEYGTGAVKVTPAHNHEDFEASKRHSLDVLRVIDEQGKITTTIANCEEFYGLPRFHARDRILSRLDQLGLLKAQTNHEMSVPICSRSKDIVELLLKPQWFLKCSDMAQQAIDFVKQGNLIIEPKHFEKNWFAWLENIRDWNLSRQLWWGHRIPAYQCHSKDQLHRKVWVAAHCEETAAQKAAELLSTNEDNIALQQDEDVLDTWFSSALLPLVAFLWPHEKEDLEAYFPLDLMETAHDILFFWVARMVMLGTQLTGQLPFKKVLLHGIICDPDGRKMSKSLGNVILPEDVINGRTLKELEARSKKSYDEGILSAEELERAVQNQKKMFPQGIPTCGADALRFTLCSHNIKSHFINFDVQECHTNKLFCNKIWQAAKFSNISMGAVSKQQDLNNLQISVEKLTPMDRWILSRLSDLIEVCWRTLDNYEFHMTTAALKNFFYYEFCDVYLETTKRGLRIANSQEAAGHCWTLVTCLHVGLRALSPFMPRLARHIYERLFLYPEMERTLNYPEQCKWRDEPLETEIATVMETVVAIRRLKKIFGVTAKHEPEVRIISDLPVYEGFVQVIGDLSACPKIEITAPHKEMSTTISNTVVDHIGTHTSVYLTVPEELRESTQLDLLKLTTKKEKLLKELEKMNKMMSGSNYRTKATAAAQESHANKIAVLKEKLARIDYLQTFSSQS